MTPPRKFVSSACSHLREPQSHRAFLECTRPRRGKNRGNCVPVDAESRLHVRLRHVARDRAAKQLAARVVSGGPVVSPERPRPAERRSALVYYAVSEQRISLARRPACISNRSPWSRGSGCRSRLLSYFSMCTETGPSFPPVLGAKKTRGPGSRRLRDADATALVAEETTLKVILSLLSIHSREHSSSDVLGVRICAPACSSPT